jgi:ATP-binding cassette subfamily F protein uup
LGGKIQEIDHIHKKYGQLTIIENFSYKFTKGERVGIIGRNGTGKSTFLDIITGLVKQDSGTIDTGETLVIGYYRQMGLTWKQNQRVIDAVKDIAEIVELKGGKTISASQFLEHFMFTPESQYKQISKLSGGELRRLHLLTVLIKNPNFLILDEPTNDLDLFALNKLEEFLLAYTGCLIIVSHDRYFLDKLTDHLFVFERGGNIKDHYGKYSEYRRQLDSGKRAAVKVSDSNVDLKKKIPKKTSAVQAKTKLSYKEQLEYSKLESEIEVLDKEKAILEKEMNAGNLEYDYLNQKSLRVAELIKLIDEKMQRWMELGQFV